MSVRRLEAEVVRDALLTVSGQISHKMSGAPVPVAPDDVGQIVVAADNRDSAGRPSKKVIPLGEEEFRRTVYVQVRRSMPLTVLEPFDMPSLAPNCEIRTQSTVAPQSLMMMNSPFVIARMKSMAQQLVQQFGNDPANLFTQAWLRTQGKTPANDDVASGIEFLNAQIEHFKSTAKPDAAPDQATIDALATLCQALVCSSGFLYVD